MPQTAGFEQRIWQFGMHVLGLVGGIASGKTTVAQQLAERGAVVLDADQAAHEVINTQEIREKLVKRWGEEITLDTGGIDRKAIAAKVFEDSPSGAVNLDYLEQLLHPRIRQRFEAELAKLAHNQTTIAVVDAPLLFEAGWANLCDSVVFVDCPLEIRQERAGGRKWTPTQFTAREASQMPIKEKKQAATHVLNSGGSLHDLSAQVDALWTSLHLDTDKTL